MVNKVLNMRVLNTCISNDSIRLNHTIANYFRKMYEKIKYKKIWTTNDIYFLCNEMSELR